jgi:bifunctional non-homologous end joining protein LigD
VPIPTGIHEIKFDGYRTILVVDAGYARAFTRNRFDWSDSYAPIVVAAERLRCRSASYMCLVSGDAA